MVEAPNLSGVSLSEVATAGVQNGSGTTTFTRTPRKEPSTRLEVAGAWTGPDAARAAKRAAACRDRAA
jgi:hypothetical protein